jgi:hypothetical protein
MKSIFNSNEDQVYFESVAKSLLELDFSFAWPRQLLEIGDGDRATKLYLFAYLYYKSRNIPILIPDKIWSYINVLKLYTIQFRRICMNILGENLTYPQKNSKCVKYIDFQEFSKVIDGVNTTIEYSTIPKSWLYYHYNPKLYILPINLDIKTRKINPPTITDYEIKIMNKLLRIQINEIEIGLRLHEHFDVVRGLLEYYCKPSPAEIRLLIVWMFSYKCLKSDGQFLPLNPSPMIDKFWHFLIIHPCYEKFCTGIFDSLFEHNPTLSATDFDRLSNRDYIQFALILDKITDQKVYSPLVSGSILESIDIHQPKENWSYQQGFIDNRVVETYYDSLPICVKSDIAHHCYTNH